MKTKASQAEELPPVTNPTGDRPPTATHAPEFTLRKLSLSGDNQPKDTVHTLSAKPENQTKVSTNNNIKHNEAFKKG